MKKTNIVLRFCAIFLMLIGFLFSTSGIAIAADKPAEDATEEVAEEQDGDKKAEGDKDKKKDKKKKGGEEEPDCE